MISKFKSRVLGPASALIAVAVALSTSTSQALDLGGLQLFTALDLVNDLGIENPPVDSGRLRVRSFEIAAFAPVDTLFDALVNVAGHDEAGTIEIELHEAYITSTRLIPRTRLKAGQFFLGVGRLNQFHSHDWPFTSAPLVQSLFFSDEAVTDTGFEVGHLIDTAVPIDVVAGVTNGWNYGHSHTSGRRPLAATHYLHPSFFFDFGENRGLLIGLNYIGRTDADSVQMRITGIDITYKNKGTSGKILETLVQGEFYHRLRSSSSIPAEEDLGGYLFGQTSLGDEGWFAGLRADAYTNLTLTSGNGERRSNLNFALVPVVSYKASEFSTFRVSYTFAQETRQDDPTRNEQKVELQLVTLLGSHPAHDF